MLYTFASSVSCVVPDLCAGVLNCMSVRVKTGIEYPKVTR